MSLFLTIVMYICWALIAAIFARALLSWFVSSRRNALAVFLNCITEPVLAPMRRLVPRLGMLDITPMVTAIILWVIIWVLKNYSP